MTGVTLTIAVAACLLVVCLHPSQAFAVYVFVMLWYPSYLVIQLGTLDVSVARFVVAALLLRCLMNPHIVNKFKWSQMDTCVSIYLAAATVIPILTFVMPFAQVIESKAGGLMDSYFAYLVARFCITDRSAIVQFAKLIGVALLPLAVLGVIEACTHWQPYAALKVYCPWGLERLGMQVARFGLARAIGPYQHAINFGSTFILFLPLLYSLRHERNYWRPLAYLLSLAAIIGAMSSMSSGPWMLAILTVFCLVLEKKKQWVKPLVIFAVSACFLVDIISNRTFYHVIVSYANPIGGEGWHRAKIIDLAIERFNEWWLVGYRGLDPGWGPLTGGTRTDLTNQYLAAAFNSGLLGMTAFCAMIVSSVHKLRQTYISTEDPILRSWCWALGSGIVALAISFNGFCLFDQTGTFFYCVLGIIGSSGNMISGPLVFHKRSLGLVKLA